MPVQASVGAEVQNIVYSRTNTRAEIINYVHVTHALLAGDTPIISGHAIAGFVIIVSQVFVEPMPTIVLADDTVIISGSDCDSLVVADADSAIIYRCGYSVVPINILGALKN